MSNPRWLELALKEIGTREGAGSGNNPRVQQYYRDAGSGWQPDSVPWCAAYVGAMLKRAGERPSGSLLARSYLAPWGMATAPKPGAIVVFSRGAPPSGHVAFFLKDNGNGTIQVVGGNQGDAVSRANYPKARVIGYRWPATRKGSAMADMTPQEIMAHAQKLYADASTIGSISGARAAAREAASLVFYLAKLHVPVGVAKGLKMKLPKPRKKKAKRK